MKKLSFLKQVVVLFIIFCSLSLAQTQGQSAKTYYVDKQRGDNANNGLSPSKAFKTLGKLGSISFNPGDKILLTSGQVFKGTLELNDVKGTANKKIIIKSTGTQKAIIDGKGKPAAIVLFNCRHVLVENLEITADGGDDNWDKTKYSPRSRLGIYVKSNKDGDYSGLEFKDLYVHHVFYHDAGYNRPIILDESTASIAELSRGTGIYLDLRKGNSSDIVVDDCKVTDVSHYGIRIRGEFELNDPINANDNIYTVKNATIKNSRTERTGFTGLKFKGIKKGLIRDNKVYQSGYRDEPRNWKRGTGVFVGGVFGIVLEKNFVKGARGERDSKGIHLDHNSTKCIVQHNVTIDNVGGFINFNFGDQNCVYRYNLSIYDGARTGEIVEVGKGASYTEAKNNYAYNNTIITNQVNKDVVYTLTNGTNGFLFMNNIVYIHDRSSGLISFKRRLPSETYKIYLKNNLFSKSFPASITDPSNFIADPQFANLDGEQIVDYIAANPALFTGAGIVSKLPGDAIGVKGGFGVSYDLAGNAIDPAKPFIGAIKPKVEDEPPSGASCFVLDNSDQVSIEAEAFSAKAAGTGNASGSKWTVISDSKASGAKAMQAGPNRGLWTGLNLNGARMDFDIDFKKTGLYYVYVRSKGSSANDDSYHIGLNGSGISNGSDYGMGGSGPWAWHDLANDDEVMKLNIQAAGKHTFNIWVREDGVQVDKIVIKKAAGIPSGTGPNASRKAPCGGDANQAPLAKFRVTPSTGPAPLRLSVNASASTDLDGSISSYAWDFGDGTTGSGKQKEHIYRNVGTYRLKLTVTDNEGLRNSRTKIIRVNPASNDPLCHEEEQGQVVIEAENFSSTSAGTGNATGKSWQKISDSNASNGEGVKAMPNKGTYTGLSINGPRLDYKILFKTAGTYRVYVRTQGPTKEDDSFHIGLNGNPVSTKNGYGMGWTGNWGWADFANEDDYVEVRVPRTGEHTFNIWMREDGVEIDKIVLKVRAGTPGGMGPDASAQIACSSGNSFQAKQGFSVEEVGGNGVINWGNFFEEFKDNYSLERSVDGNTFEVLENAEIIVDETYHTHTDPNVRQYGSQLIKYRLKIKDSQGVVKQVREGILNFREAASRFDFKVFPNPASSKLNFEFNNSSGKDLELSIINSLGQGMHTESVAGEITDGLHKLDISRFSPGIYFIRLSDHEQSQVIRVLVE